METETKLDHPSRRTSGIFVESTEKQPRKEDPLDDGIITHRTTKMFTGTNDQVRFLQYNTTYHTTVCVNNTAQYRTVQHSTAQLI